MMCSLFMGLKVAAQQPSAKNPVAPRPVIILCKGVSEKMMDEHGNSKRYDKHISSRFKNQKDPEIIAVDKLLTGFDVRNM